jgi:hypothetical protein
MEAFEDVMEELLNVVGEGITLGSVRKLHLQNVACAQGTEGASMEMAMWLDNVE